MSPKNSYRPEVEALEDRDLLSVSISFSKQTGVLSLNGSDRADRNDYATVRVQGNKVVATIIEKALNGKVKDREVKKVKLALVKQIGFDGNAGDDTFANRTAIASLAYGNAGNDVLEGGTGMDTLLGEDGNDTLYGGAGSDRLFGGSGNDELYGSSGIDQLLGGAGSDYLWGGESADFLQGDDGNDELHGDDGDDWIYGLAGYDTLYGGSGNDRLDGGADADWLYGGAGEDNLDGGRDGARDELYGGTDRDLFIRYYHVDFLFFRSYPEENVNDREGWDSTYEVRIN